MSVCAEWLFIGGRVVAEEIYRQATKSPRITDKL